MDSILHGSRKLKLIDYATAFAYAVGAISGLAGGCLVAVHKILHGRRVSGVIALAYSFVGLVFGLAGVIGLRLFTDWSPAPERAFIAGLWFGVIGAVAVAAANLSVRFTLPIIGKEMQVEIRDAPRKGR